MTMSIEYLAIFRRTDSFCDSVASFIRLLQVDSKVKLTSGDVHYEGRPTCRLQILNGDVADKKQRYFLLRFTWDGDADASGDLLDRFVATLKAIRGAVAQADGEIETLWDDLSAHYARKAYPMIHEIENMMRRLIANFMLVTVGREWAAETLPRAVEDAVKSSKRKDYLNILDTVDFIHLGDFLFAPYSKKSTPDLYQRLKSVKTLDDIAALKDFLPESNWQRYFRTIVKCDDSYLRSRWEKLYELRCKVAHNALMTVFDFAQIEKLIGELKPKLEEAIAEISKVTVPPDEAEAVAESAVRGVNSAIGEFISMWQQVESVVVRRLMVRNVASRAIPRTLELLHYGILKDDADVAAYDEMRRVRNTIVHGPTTEVPAEVIQGYVASLHGLLETVGEVGFVEALCESPDDDARRSVLEERLDEAKQDIVESEAFCNAMADTNASGWDVDEISVEDFDVDIKADVCRVRISYVASGEQLEDKMYFGTKISGNAEATIDGDGNVLYEAVSAEVNHDGDGDHEEPDT